MKKMNQKLWIIITLLVVVIVISAISISIIAAPDYATALKNSIIFFDGNKCGPNATSNNLFSWRGACHTSDGSDKGVNLK